MSPTVRSAKPPFGAHAGSIRPPFRDNPRLILVGIALLLAALAAMVVLAERSAELSPDFLSGAVLYAVTAADLTMLAALVFVLARNVVKLLVERRRALPFARFRAKLVAAMLGLTLIPAVLVLIVGSELIRNSADRWFSAPVDDVLSSANAVASGYYHDRQVTVSEHADRIAGSLAGVDLAAADVGAVRDLISTEVTEGRVELVQVYRVVAESDDGRADVVPVVDVATSSLPQADAPVSADRLASRVLAGSAESWTVEPLAAGGDLVRAAALVPGPDGGAPLGVVVASSHLTGDVADHSRRITQAYEAYSQLRVLQRPLQGVYLSFFLMVTLLILVSATWMGVYIAKRIMRPVHLLSDGARALEAGQLDHRIEPETADEFGSLVEAFNSMAGGLAVSQRKLERSQADLRRKNVEVEGRRRYIETILERIATGVVSIDADGTVGTVNRAASRLLGLTEAAVGRPASEVFDRADLRPMGALLDSLPAARDPSAREVALEREGKAIHVAVAATTLQRAGAGGGGTVMVFDDVTPLIRAQRVATWRDVARRLAHEIRNPLTPIQLCAERLRRHFSTAPPPARALVEECSGTIVGEVESLKALVDEFSQFARMPAPRTVPVDLHALLDDALRLYDGLFDDVRIDRAFAPQVPAVRADPEQLRRVVINLVDNAIEVLRGAATGGAVNNGNRGLVVVGTAHAAADGIVRITVADNGPGIPPGDRDKLFMPYYSTKQRGSGLGLAIVRRIIVEHGGNIEVGDNGDRGSTFTVELPCSA
ncbi:MAG: hypothetical protein CL471_12920 [Acidobacteria bacterium]|nr:hypothetical protein [Acidobacteriota bacterium]